MTTASRIVLITAAVVVVIVVAGVAGYLVYLDRLTEAVGVLGTGGAGGELVRRTVARQREERAQRIEQKQAAAQERVAKALEQPTARDRADAIRREMKR